MGEKPPGWRPPQYKWLGTTIADNGIEFHNIFETADIAKQYYAGEVLPDEWREDASGNLKASPAGTEYRYEINQERYHDSLPDN